MSECMISAPQPEAVEAGLEIFKAGGNVVDAAIAAALVQTVVDPQMCGIAGFANSFGGAVLARRVRREGRRPGKSRPAGPAQTPPQQSPT